MSHLLDHPLVFRTGTVGIFLQVDIRPTLEILDDAAGEQFKVTLRVSEINERTTVNQWWTRDSSMHLFGSVVEEHPHIVA